ncbi:caspase family protein [uncultured Paraglaciecola sp.]|uniref:caspase family protein n=1 Tax=uncultured Paraglaciecola sp. TaxID=1765024 RepID=UPI0030DA5057|tara:strand:+ start:22736 stop:23611 length:876 start_codon:yes stop_codon:yes gene_type:complete
MLKSKGRVNLGHHMAGLSTIKRFGRFKTLPTLTLLLITLCFSAFAFEDNVARFALVIGNQNYQQAPLKNPINDAESISASLLELGFSVTTVLDSDSTRLKSAVSAFYGNIQQANTSQALAVFYYAGHAIQIEHHNYLVPLDIQFGEKENFDTVLFDLNSLFAEMAKVNNVQNIVILDACRNNPFAVADTAGSRAISVGLAPLKAPFSTLIAYATEPGGVASDGKSKNGIYTKHLLRHIDKKITIEEVFKQVRKGVAKETHNKQIPWEHSSLLREVFINPPRNKNVPDLIAF